MARIRTIKPEFPQSQTIGRLSRDARLLFILLWPLCDDAGRTRGNPRMVASLLFPYDDDAPRKIDGWLQELSNQGCIVRYEVDNCEYIEIRNWLKHQKIDKPGRSYIPSPLDDSRTFANIREDSTTIREHSPLDQGRDQGKEGTKDQDRERDQGPDCNEPAKRTSLKPSVANPDDHVFPVFGCACGKENGPIAWQLAPDLVEEWQLAFPAVDIYAECRKAHAWVKTNWAKRKTAKGMPDFLRRWLDREQDSGGGARAASRRDDPRGNKAMMQTLLGELNDGN